MITIVTWKVVSEVTNSEVDRKQANDFVTSGDSRIVNEETRGRLSRPCMRIVHGVSDRYAG
jgi:hypothetical protein